MWYQDVQSEISIIWKDKNSPYCEKPIGVRVYGKNYFHGLENIRGEGTREQRTMFQFSDSETIREEWRNKYLVMTPDLMCYQIVSEIGISFGSWKEILKNRTVVVIE